MKKVYLLLFLVGFWGACTSPDFSEQYSENEKNRIDSIVFAGRNIDTLRVMVDRFSAEDNLYGQVVACRELGRSYRNASMFAEAVDIHKRGLCCAEKICDTIQIIQALNNIGTDYRRMGILDEASSYHYQAIAEYREAYNLMKESRDRWHWLESCLSLSRVYLLKGYTVN